MATREIQVREVKALKTRAGNTRFVLVDDDGDESSVKEEVPPEDLFAKLQPFKQLVADDSERPDDHDDDAAA